MDSPPSLAAAVGKGLIIQSALIWMGNPVSYTGAGDELDLTPVSPLTQCVLLSPPFSLLTQNMHLSHMV